MEFSRGKIRQIRHLMILAALLILALIYSEKVFMGVAFLFGITSPFLVGGAMAFVLNIPMRGFEEKVFGRWKGRAAAKFKRPLCLVLSIVVLAVILAVVVGTVVPQIVTTASEIGRKIPAFTDKVLENLDRLMKDYPEVTAKIDELELTEINWDSMLDSVIDFLKNGAGDVLNSTVSVASGIISGIMNTVIAFIFALYVLTQKEKLAEQGRRILSAYLPDKVGAKTLEIFSLLHKNFSSFITGQCLEAVILGTMFVVAMSLFGMPYALMVGVLIAFTALIPIVGGFIGCAVGAFMILIDNPLQALWFVILFLVLQQIEGNLIYPKVVGNSVGLPAIWVLVAVSVGGSLFGISGMLFFIPLTSSGYALLRESVNDRNARRRMQAAQRKGNRPEDKDVVMEEDGGTDAPAKKVPEAKAPERKAGERKNGKRS